MANDYLPPVVCEIILRTADLTSGAAKVRSEMSATADSVEASSARASKAADDSSKRMVMSAKAAGDAAREQAAAMGKSAAEQAAAAGKAAEEFTVAQQKMTAAQKAAAQAAADAAAAAGASADEQAAAYARAATAAEVEGEKISKSQRLIGESMGNLGRVLGGSASGPLRGIGNQISETEHKARSLSGTLGEIGKVTVVGGIGGFAAAAYEGVKAATAFQTSLAHIAADSSQKNANQIGNAFLGTMGKSAYSANEMAQSYAQVSKQLQDTAGHALSASQAMQVMNASQDLAEGSGVALGQATQSVAQMMQAYHLSAGQAAQAANTLYQVSRITSSPISDIAMAAGRLHARLGELAPSLRDVGGLMVAAAQHGMTGSRGIMVMQQGFQTLLSGSTQVDETLKALGVNLYNSQGKFVGMNDVIAQLAPKFAGLSQQTDQLAAKTLFGQSAADLMLSVIRKGPSAFAADQQAATKAGAAHQAAAAQSHTLAHEMEVVKATLDDLATKLGQMLIPVIQSVVGDLSSLVGWFQKNQGAAEALAGVIATVLGAAVAVFVGQKIASFISGVSGMVTGIGRFIGVMAPAQSETATLTSAVQDLTAALSPVSEEAGAAGTTVSGLGSAAATAAPEITGLDTALAGANEQLTLFDGQTAAAGVVSTLGTDAGTAAGGVGLLETKASGLLGVLTKLADIGTIAITVGVAFEAFNQISKILGSGGNPLKYMTPTARGLIAGQGGLSGNRNPFSPANAMYTGGAQGSAITGSSAPWVQLGISKSRWEHLSAKQKASLGAIPGTTGANALPPGYTYTASTAYNAKAFPRGENEFITALAAKTGLNPAVLAGWALNEEGYGGVANSANPYNFLNVGESGTTYRGSPTTIWKNPLTAAAATAQWIKTGTGVPGWKGSGTSITASAGGSIASQISAIQNSGWVNGTANDPAGNYPTLASFVRQAMGNATGGTAGINTTALGQVLNPAQAAKQAGVAGLTSSLAADISKYQGLQQTAAGQGNTYLAGVYGKMVSQIQALSKSIEGQAKGSLTTQQITLLKDTLHTDLAKIIAQGGVAISHANEQFKVAAQIQRFQGLQQTAQGTGNTYLASAYGSIIKELDALVKAGGGTVTALQKIEAQGGTAVALANKEYAAASTIARYQSAVQTGSAPSLEKILGARTGTVTGQLHGAIEAYLRGSTALPAAQAAFQAHPSPGTATALHNALLSGGMAGVTSVLSRATQGSAAETQYRRELAPLQTAARGGSAGAQRMVQQLVAAHKAALATLAQQLIALQETKDAASLSLQATHITDQAKLTADVAASQLKVTNDQQKMASDAVTAQATAAADQVAIAQAAADAQVTAIKDMSQTASDQFSGMAQAIQDQTQLMSDQSSGIVQGMADSTKTQTDTLTEKGLYGYNLIAQQLQVQLDTMKTGYDQQIAVAKQNVDATKATWDATINADQLAADQVQAQQDALVAAARLNAANAQLHADNMVAQATAQADSAQSHADSLVAVATQKVDTVQLAEDIKVALAQNAVTMSATGSQAQQKAAAAALSLAQGQAAKADANANAALSAAQTSANQITAAAQDNLTSVSASAKATVDAANNQLTAVQNTAALAEANAQATLSSAQGQAAVAEANSQQALQAIQDTAAQQEQAIQDQIDVAQAQQQALQQGGGTFNPYTSLTVGANGALSFSAGQGGGNGTLPWQQGGGLVQNNTFNVQQQADTAQLANEIGLLMRPYLTGVSV